MKTTVLKFYEILCENEIVKNKTEIVLNHHSHIKYIRLVEYEVGEKLLLVFFSDYIQVWRTSNYTLKCGIKAKITSTRAVEIYLNRVLIIGTTHSNDKRYFIEMWYLDKCQLINKRSSVNMISALKLINNNSLASSYYFSNKILIWSILESMIATKVLEANTKLVVYFETNRKLLITANLNGTLNIWNTSNWELQRIVEFNNSRFIIYMKLISNESLLVIDTSGSISVFNYSSSVSNVTTIRQVSQTVIQVENFDQDRFMIATLNGSIIVWNMKTYLIEKEYFTNESIYSFVYSKSEKRKFFILKLNFYTNIIEN